MKAWITKDGRAIPLGQLENGHLINIVLMLRRNLQCAQADFDACMCAMPRDGDMALYYADQELTSASDHVAAVRARLADLEEEAERREILDSIDDIEDARIATSLRAKMRG